MPSRPDSDALADHLDGVRRLVRTLVRDEAEVDDVVQDTMVAALESRTQVRGGLRAWLGGVARNMVRRTARSEGRRANHEHAALAHGTVPATADVIARAAEQRRVLDTLLGMEEPYRSAVLLRFVEDLPPRKIAKRLDMPVETVRTHIKRGIQRLRDRLGQAHNGDREQLRAALALAASEPLGAAHARAVALARASGLVVLLALCAGAILWFGRSGIDDAVEERRPELIADTPATDAPKDPAAVPTAANIDDRKPMPSAVPPITIARKKGETGGGDDAPLVRPDPDPDAGTARPHPEIPPVRPVEPERRPDPRVAIEEKSAKKDGAKSTKQGSGAKPPPEGEAEDDADGDFYEGETSFTGPQVGKAIDKGVAWLIKRQGRDGSWGGIQFNSTYGGSGDGGLGMRAGPTALALYTLLKCKVPLNHPAVKRGFKYLDKHFEKPPSSYETSMLLLAVTATADNYKQSGKQKVRPKLTGKYRKWANKLVDHLVKKREARGWRYNVKKGQTATGGPEDLSSTQLAALALFSAHQLGIKVKTRVWEDILAFTLEQQAEDGPEIEYTDPVDPSRKRTARARGFAYIRTAQDEHESRSRGGMTACGLANLEMARYVLSDGGRKRDKWDRRKDAARVQQAIFDGIAWLEENWSPFEDPKAEKKNVYHVYWLYALERAMDLLGLKLLGSHRWYSEGGQELLNRQLAQGHWQTRRGQGHDILDTSFALLFLKRASGDYIPVPSVTGGTGDPADNR